MKKIFSLVLGIILSAQIGAFANCFDRTISKSNVNKSAVSVLIKDINSGKVIYKLHANQPKMPASTLKLVTAGASIDTLGYDYEFSTKLYKSTNNDLYLQLGGDPFFTSSNLNNLFKSAKEKNIIEPKTVYIDDFIFDSTIWGEGWQWDDDLNIHMPKFSSYNIDNNILKIIINPTQPGSPAEIKTTKFYPVTFMNLVTTDTSDSVKIKRNNSISPDIINFEGTVSKQMIRHIPVNNLKRYFKLRLDDAIRSAKIDYYGKYPQKKLPADNVYLVDEVNHPISKAIEAILKDSNNLVAESLFKAAGAKFVNNTGSLEHSQQMLSNYFSKIGINTDDIRIVDGSGVSKNNLVTAEFMTDFLAKIANDELFVNTLPTPGEGTLKERMLYFKDNLRAKTGTLSDVSAIAGYITARSGKKYAFDIMINDPKSSSQEKKSLEEYILRDIYTNY